MNYYIMYLRKSRADRPDESVEEVVAKHESILQDYAKRRLGHAIPEENIYREVVSGETIADRPYMQKVLQIIEQKECLGVLVADPQRITRGDLLDCGTIVNAFRYSDTHVVTPMHDYDLSLDMDRRYFQDELLRGNDYLEYSKRIMRAGREESVKRGNYIGSTIPFGYERYYIDKHPTLKINDYEAYYVRKIFGMKRNGKGFNEIATWLNEQGVKTRKGNSFTMPALRSLVKNDIYIGYIRWNGTSVIKVYEDGEIKKKRVKTENEIRVKGLHEPIVDENLFYEVQDILAKAAAKVPKKRKLVNPFAGILRCGVCGSVLCLMRLDGKKPRYVCHAKMYGQCTNVSVLETSIKTEVIKVLKHSLEDFEVQISNGKTSRPDHKVILDKLHNERKEIEKKQMNLYDLLESGVYTKEVFRERNDKLAQERADNIQAIEKIKKEAENKNRIVDMTKSLKHAIDALEDNTVSVEAKNHFLKGIIDSIYVTKTEIKKRGEPESFELRINLK